MRVEIGGLEIDSLPPRATRTTTTITAISAPLDMLTDPLSDPDAPAVTPPCGLAGAPSGCDDPTEPGAIAEPMPAPSLPFDGAGDCEGEVDVVATAELGVLDCAMAERGAKSARTRAKKAVFLTIVAVGRTDERARRYSQSSWNLALR
jgi:hypothetical protein